MNSEREYRLKFAVTDHEFVNNPSSFAKVSVGSYGNHIVVRADGNIIIKPTAHADDVISFVAGCIRNHPGIPKHIKQYLITFIGLLDQLSVKNKDLNLKEDIEIPKEYFHHSVNMLDTLLETSKYADSATLHQLVLAQQLIGVLVQRES